MSKRTKEGDEIQRKKRARLRFKRIVRIALANCQWITEMEEQGITLNVKKNVAMLVRKKHKTGILTMAQKGLLAAAHHTRTIPERKKLCSIVAGLGCFTQIPPKIRARLVPYLHFMSVSANRLLMKEGDVPTAVYFVVSGEVEMSRKIYNKVTRKTESKPEAFFGPGDWIGEVEVLELELRMNTYRTTNTCEILILYDTDFETILKPYVKKVWVEKKKAIASLSYLKFMNEAQIISACKFGIIRKYDPLDTIYPEEKDNILHVHFVLSGECLLLQCLHMKKVNVKGELHYELSEVVNMDNTDSDAEDEKQEPFDVRELLRSSSSLDELGHNKKKAKRKAEFAKIEQNCLLLNQKPASVVIETPNIHHMYHTSRSATSVSHKSFEQFNEFEDFENYDEFYTDHDYATRSKKTSSIYETYHKMASVSSRTSKFSKLSKSSLARGASELHKNSKTDIEAETESKESEIFTVSSSSSSTPSLSVKSRIHDDENFATHFIDIGSMYFGGVFGVGEKSDHRVVMARTTVQCLLIPRYWLMEDDQNPGHMWQRMRFYLDRCIPSRETLFFDFIKTRKWAHFKKDCVEELTHSTTNPTKVEDIPIIILIVEPNSDS